MKDDDAPLPLDYEEPNEPEEGERLSVGEVNGAMIFGSLAGLVAILFLICGVGGVIYLAGTAPRRYRLEDAPFVFVTLLIGSIAAFASFRWLRAGIRSLRR